MSFIPIDNETQLPFHISEGCYSKSSPQNNSISSPRNDFRNSESQALPQATWTRVCILTRSQMICFARTSLKSASWEKLLLCDLTVRLPSSPVLPFFPLLPGFTATSGPLSWSTSASLYYLVYLKQSSPKSFILGICLYLTSLERPSTGCFF